VSTAGCGPYISAVSFFFSTKEVSGHETRKQKAAFVFLSVPRASYIDVYIATDVRAAATVAACLS